MLVNITIEKKEPRAAKCLSQAQEKMTQVDFEPRPCRSQITIMELNHVADKCKTKVKTFFCSSVFAPQFLSTDKSAVVVIDMVSV